METLAETWHAMLVQLFILCCSILCSLLPRALQEPAPEQETLGLQEPQAPLPSWQQVPEDAEAVRGWCGGEPLSQWAHGAVCACGVWGHAEVGPCLEQAGGVSREDSHCQGIKCFSLVSPFGLAKPCI